MLRFDCLYGVLRFGLFMFYWCSFCGTCYWYLLCVWWHVSFIAYIAVLLLRFTWICLVVFIWVWLLRDSLRCWFLLCFSLWICYHGISLVFDWLCLLFWFLLVVLFYLWLFWCFRFTLWLCLACLDLLNSLVLAVLFGLGFLVVCVGWFAWLLCFAWDIVVGD